MNHRRRIFWSFALALAVAGIPFPDRAAARTPPPSLFSLQSQDAPNKPPQARTQKLRNPLNDLLDEAQADLDKNDFEAALVPLQKFLAEKPDVAFAHFQLAYALTAVKRTDEARVEYQKAAQLDPKMAEAQLNLGILLLEKDPSAAAGPLRKATELLPAQTRPRFLLGLALERSGDVAGATASFEAASHLDPNDVETLTHLGAMYLLSSRPADAEGKFRHALEIQPQSPMALQGLAQSLDAQKKPDAAEAYRNYIAVQPGDAAARNRLIHILIEQQQYDAALAEIDRATAGQQPAVETLMLRADVQIAQRKLDDAIITLRQAVALAPNDAHLHGGLGHVLLQKRDFPAAEKELKNALQLDRNNLAYWKDLSSVFYLSENYPATLSALDLIAKAETLNAGQWFIRALCYDKLDEVRPALDAYRKFLELDQNKNPNQVWQANQRIHVLEKRAQNKK
ncbi:MAG TPA: tetratricopeptide repeat protein [Verrucomicrobiae bacterium]|nr:tetratricopeptide repeat protein [Verrucomicrobiae bacterium]